MGRIFEGHRKLTFFLLGLSNDTSDQRRTGLRIDTDVVIKTMKSGVYNTKTGQLEDSQRVCTVQ